MHAGPYVPCSQPLQLLPGLQQQAALGDGHRHPPPVAQPHEQPREAGLAVDGQKVEVVVEACNAGAGLAVRVQIAACTSPLLLSLFYRPDGQEIWVIMGARDAGAGLAAQVQIAACTCRPG